MTDMPGEAGAAGAGGLCGAPGGAALCSGGHSQEGSVELALPQRDLLGASSLSLINLKQ